MPLLSNTPYDRGAGTATFGGNDNSLVGFWFSNTDWEWWPVYLGEIREEAGNPSLSMDQAKQWWATNTGGALRSSVPRDFGPQEDKYSFDSTGRTSPSGGGGGGRGGGSGAAPPVYRGPDEAAVREQIKMYVVATTGRADADLVDKALASYLAADKEAFSRDVADAGNQVDPFTAVKDLVRGSAQYKTIHAQRPDSVDELDWVTSRQAKLRQLGLSAERAENLGIKQAQMGANDDALGQAAEMQFSSDTGRLLDMQKQKIKQSASAVLGLI